jgi:hypothetical protein
MNGERENGLAKPKPVSGISWIKSAKRLRHGPVSRGRSRTPPVLDGELAFEMVIRKAVTPLDPLQQFEALHDGPSVIAGCSEEWNALIVSL